MIDTHAHIYSVEFDADRTAVIERAQAAGVKAIVLPNCDSTTLQPMLDLEADFPGYCFAAIGLHPTSVKQDYKQELLIIESELKRRKYVAVGEIGMDLYWDKTYLREQSITFEQQIQWALAYNLPVIIHVRNALAETIEIMEPYRQKELRGVFHSFAGSVADAQKLLSFEGFLLGINGIVSFKNSILPNTLPHIPLDRIILETDSPYLTPTPYRGKRNESSYLQYIVPKIATIYNKTNEDIVRITKKNAIKLFDLH
ncbi:MAG: hydrolase TatD [Porphyromonadaceae bacterium CG2_30_38_12]|nr:MAG: hydrolase TatD [Porphyromonadaceae bacterium CG2_30_38_12]